MSDDGHTSASGPTSRGVPGGVTPAQAREATLADAAELIEASSPGWASRSLPALGIVGLVLALILLIARIRRSDAEE